MASTGLMLMARHAGARPAKTPITLMTATASTAVQKSEEAYIYISASPEGRALANN